MSLKLIIPGEKCKIKNVISRVLKEIKQAGIGGGKLDFQIELCLRELLANAVEYGCRDGEDDEIEINLEIRARKQVVITIEDPGPGFDVKNSNWKEMPELAEAGRGLPLVYSVVEKMKFNEEGNRVTIYLDINKNGGKSESRR